MWKSTKIVALDQHMDSITVAFADGGRRLPQLYGTIPSTPSAVAKLARRLDDGRTQLRFCYEAGPCGYGLYRQLTTMGYECLVVAPSLTPRRPGERIKTDRRDALTLARYHRSGDLVAVWVPDEERLGALSRRFQARRTSGAAAAQLLSVAPRPCLLGR